MSIYENSRLRVNIAWVQMYSGNSIESTLYPDLSDVFAKGPLHK